MELAALRASQAGPQSMRGKSAAANDVVRGRCLISNLASRGESVSS